MSFTAARGLQTRWWIGLPLFKICYSINHWCVLWITGVTAQGQGLDCSEVLMQRDGTSIRTCARAICMRFKQTWQVWFMATCWYPVRGFSQMMPRAQEVGACRDKAMQQYKDLESNNSSDMYIESNRIHTFRILGSGSLTVCRCHTPENASSNWVDLTPF